MSTNVQTIVDLCKAVEILLEENASLRAEADDLIALVEYYQNKPQDNKPKLSAGDVVGIHNLRRLEVPISEIAKIYGVNKSTISRTLKGIYNT